MKAFLIDPLAKTVAAVEYGGELEHMYELLNCRRVDRAILNAAGDTLWIDDEGLAAEDFAAVGLFGIRDYGEPFIGRGLVLGADAEGKSTAPRITLDELRYMIGFQR